MVSDASKALNRLGQSLWLDNIMRNLLDSGTLQRYIDELSVTGLTSNPTIFDHAISHSSRYDAEIRRRQVVRHFLTRVARGDRREEQDPGLNLREYR